MQELTKRSFTKIKIIFGIVYGYMAIALATVMFFQIIRSVEYFQKAQLNRARVRFIPAYRSVIYDRNLQTQLAYNVKSLSLVVIPGLLPSGTNRTMVIENLAVLLNTSSSNINAMIEEQALDKFTPIVIASDIDAKTMVRFAEHQENFPGVYMENLPRRFYPLAEKAAHLLGYTGIISKAEYQQLKDDPEYYAGAIVGKMGIEKQYDKQLRGKKGIMNRVVDAKGKLIREEIAEEPQHAQPVVLTIDARLQAMAYDLLAGRNGAVVVSKPYTGEVLALVSSASFNPNVFSDRYSREEFYIIRDNENKPFLNRAIQGIYPPSSTFKLISAVAILASGIDVNRIVYCRGSMRIANRIFNCWDVHHAENFFDGIANSCDVYFYTMGLEVGKDKILAYARDFGIQEKTGIDLPGEAKGLIPEEAWFKRRYNRPWSPGDTANISIGQGDLLITPVGLNKMTAAIANRGTVYRPFLLKAIIDEVTRETLWENKPQVLRKVVLPETSFDLLQKAMYKVTTEGTARWVQYATPYPIAGKTGTGEAGKDKETHALFTAFAPYGSSNPEDYIVVTVVVEHGGGGSAAAAPIAVKLIDYYFREIHPLNPNQFKR
ncbi:Peptidoglycan D,D-transpeptidase MrdA [Brevinematales bacterium NS]|nr:penicillin-binding protein 2 [Brevinematales bacterium]QJR21567.1 Peptidoglycan D,D-transpeptidase MrdA [Brevinematales bacterium NS]